MLKAAFGWLTCISLTAASIAAAGQDQRTLKVTIPGIVDPMPLVLPVGFSSASTDAERHRRTFLIESLQDNPSGKAVVADVYLVRWDDSVPFPLPLLFVGTLPAAVAEQGRIPPAFWSQMREGLVKQATAQLESVVRQLEALGHTEAGAQLRPLVSAGGPDSVLLFRFSPRDENRVAPMLGARKLSYFRQAIILFELAVDATPPGSVDALVRYVNEVHIQP